MDTVRGGALKTERDSGIVNIITCTFRENFSSYGGAIYDRSNIMNIIGSFFLDNASSVSTPQARTEAILQMLILPNNIYTGHWRSNICRPPRSNYNR